MEITFLTDNPDSWILPYVKKLKTELETTGKYNIKHIYNLNEITEGSIMFILSCEKIIPEDKLKYHNSNIVVHPSKLPQGKGWSPLAWQILEGKNKIPVTLFEAAPEVDSGNIYLTDTIKLDGSELNDEIKHAQGEMTIKLVLQYIKDYNNSLIEGYKQGGKETFYPKMIRKNNELDINKSIKEQFNTLRIVDNERYPAFFNLNGNEYIIKIWKK